jgi:5,10-methylene-tetrahydrofolate dehydrogenase/methenyl tetrahydrofolate cyclohydrolase
MSATDDLRSATLAAQKAREEIDRCLHNFEQGEITTEAYTFDRGESIGTSSSWVRVRYRKCQKCGVQQKTIQFAPDMKFGKWEEVK